MTQVIDKFRGEFFFLSNFCDVSHGVYGYRSVEHFFQAMKSQDQDYRQQLKQPISAADARKLGRRAALREDWDRIKDEVMLTGLRAKFRPHTQLAAKLLATGVAQLIEGNAWHDLYWGQCVGCRRFGGHEPQGANRLGNMLMQVRQELRD